MKVLRLVLFLLVVSPGTALASGTTLSAHDVRPGVNRPAHRFDLVGLHWKGTGGVSFRTRTVVGRWTGWRDAAPAGLADRQPVLDGPVEPDPGAHVRPRDPCPRLLRLEPDAEDPAENGLE